jgi:hypothetical protein
MKSLVMAAAFAFALGVMACATEPNKDPTKLEFTSTGKSTLTVGETSPRWSVSKTYVDPNGRTKTTESYTFFTLISSDTTIAGIVGAQQLIGKNAGTAVITAVDDKNSSLVTEVSVKITIVEAP